MNRIIRFGYNHDFYPFACLCDGKGIGLLIDIATEATTRTGSVPEFIPITSGSLLSSLQGGSVDALVGTVDSGDGRSWLAYSHPLTITGGAWFFPRDHKQRSGAKKIATPEHGPLVPIIEMKFPGVEIIGTADYRSSFQSVIEGNADGAALNLQAGRYQAERDFPGSFALPTEYFHTIPLVSAFRADLFSDYVATYDRILTELKGDGTIGHITEKAQIVTPPTSNQSK